ncbi:MAG: DNA repair protein RecN [Pelotomaculum sp. PtaU1.Bin035]|nr:MAG: DNA repair protein RecN [Pelotomaculum sp. PtaU1.Bin035]
MLLNLFVRNFGLVYLLTIDFQAGLNVLTGETGTGKSIIIDALQVALGGRIASEQIRTGSEKALVQATFDIKNSYNIISMLEEQGIDLPDDGILILTREITHAGKNICRLNGHVVTLGFYKNISRNLVDLHVQHEQHSLLDQERHRHLLDRFGGAPVLEALREVNNIYFQWKETLLTFERLSSDVGEKLRQSALFRHQIDEIEGVALKPGEDEELSVERKLLANTEKICLLSAESYSLLYEGSHGQASVTDLLSRGLESVKNLTLLDERLEYLHKSLECVLYQVEDIARELAGFRDKVEHNPQRLEAVEERLELINNLKKKYQKNIPEILSYLDYARNELENLESGEELAEAAERELKMLEQSYWRVAEILSACRQRAAKILEEAISRELASLEMGRVEFQVAFTKVTGMNQGGAEHVDFLISPNPGEPLKPMARIVSGGELSRIMLAMKALLANVDEIPVLIFDEVDTGIGGRALHAVAEKLAGISEHSQVICVTHAAQIASHADVHYRVFKEIEGERTFTRVEPLDLTGKVEELARMIGGREVTDITRRHARQMLRAAIKKLR